MFDMYPIQIRTKSDTSTRSLILSLQCIHGDKSIDIIVETDGRQKVGGYIYHCGWPMIVVAESAVNEYGDVIERHSWNMGSSGHSD